MPEWQSDPEFTPESPPGEKFKVLALFLQGIELLSLS